MQLTLTMVDTGSMILVVLIVLSRVDSVVDVCDESTLFYYVFVQRVLTFSLFRQSGVAPLVIAVCGKKLSFKANPCQKLLSCFAGCVSRMIAEVLCKFMPTLETDYT